MVGDRGQPFSFEYFYCLIRGPAGGCCHHDFIYPQFFSPFSGKLQGLIGIVFSGFVKIHGALLFYRFYLGLFWLWERLSSREKVTSQQLRSRLESRSHNL
jgi:hypothetical protein